MTPEVKELLEQLFTAHKSKKAVQVAFVDRRSDVAFATIAYTAARTNPAAPDIENYQAAVWLGYEISVDSEHLGSIWR